MSSFQSSLLAGRRILVTGAARGLGFAFARSACEAGAQVVLADVLTDVVRAAAAQLVEQGYAARALSLDLGDPESITRCATDAAAAFGGLDGLINNAAITNSGGKVADDLDPETWDAVMQVNVRGTWLMSRACHPALRASGRGAIVNMASDTALWGAPKLLAYVASKGAIISMTRALAREYGSDSITTNAIAPGLVLVEATEYVPQDRHRLYVEQRALQRQQLPDDVCGAAIFLLSDLSRFVTGQTLPVNGGFVFN